MLKALPFNWSFTVVKPIAPRSKGKLAVNMLGFALGYILIAGSSLTVLSGSDITNWHRNHESRFCPLS